MSLVERALRKLQETRGTPEPPQPTRETTPQDVRPRATARQEASAIREAVPDPMPAEKPSRTVRIDRQALRQMELLPPVNLERQIAGQYQHVKRPLVTAALGKTETPIPNAHLIMMASALPSEGKTFTSINLALSMALEKDIEVVLVDADVAKPHVTRIFGLENERGLLDLLTDSALRLESLILPTDEPRLSILPAGRPTSTATELIASERMDQLIQRLSDSRRGRRIVLFDSPPLLLSTESRALVHSMGQIVLVVRAERTSRQAVMDAIEAIESVGENKPISLILNQTSDAPSTGYYGYGTYETPPADSQAHQEQPNG